MNELRKGMRYIAVADGERLSLFVWTGAEGPVAQTQTVRQSAGDGRVTADVATADLNALGEVVGIELVFDAADLLVAMGGAGKR